MNASSITLRGVYQHNCVLSIAERALILNAWRVNGVIDNEVRSSGDECNYFE
jgi:hypothetical protein